MSVWSTVTSTPTTTALSASAVGDGSVWLFGGETSVGSGSAVPIYEYDPLTDAWTEYGTFLGTNLTAGVYAGGYLYAIGGRTTAQVQRWQPGGSIESRTDLPAARQNPTAETDGSLIWALGGDDSNDDATATVYEYDISGDSWSSLTSMSQARVGHGSTLVDGYIYVFGGEDASGNALSSVERYDISADSWTTMASLPTARAVASGYHDRVDAYAVTDGPAAYRYDISADSWTTIETPAEIHNDGAVVGVKPYHIAAGGANAVLLSGGEGSDTTERRIGEYEPFPPANLATTASGTDISLSWDQGETPEELEGTYNVYRSTDPGSVLGDYTQIATGVSTTSYTDSGLSEGVKYHYVITGVNSVGESAPSTEQTATLYLPPPSGLSISNVGFDSADASWTDNATDETAHRVLTTRGRRYFDFDGVDDAVSYSHDAADLTGESAWTMGAWVYWDGSNTGTNKYIHMIGSFEVMLYIDGNENWAVYLNDGSSANTIFEPATANAWTHIAGRLQSGTLSLWVNGNQVGTTSVGGPARDNPAQNTIGTGANAGGPFPGRISDVCVYDVALAGPQIGDLADDTIPTPGDLLAYYPLDEDRSGTTPDMSGFDNDATISGATVGGTPYVDQSGALAANTTAYSLSGLLNGEQYRAKVRVETTDAEAEVK